MAGESQQVPHSEPDPSVMTTEQLDRGLTAERDYVDGRLAVVTERLRGIDEATRVLHETVNRVPTDVQQAVGHQRELNDEKFRSIEIQFKERDTRSERESTDNKLAVDAAFAAQEKQAAAQNKSNAEAIGKSEASTAETINKLSELFETRTRALDDKIVEIQRRADRFEAVKVGVGEERTEQRQSVSANQAIIGLIVTIILATIAIVGFIAANSGGGTP